MKLSGKISDKLRAELKDDDPSWNPGRPESPTKASPLPKGVQGESMTGRKR